MRIERVRSDPDRVLPDRRTYAPEPPPGARILSGPCAVVDDDTNEVVGFQSFPDLGPARRVASSFRSIEWDGTAEHGNEFRLSGIVNAHRTFGYSAPVPLRRRYGCSVCAFDAQYPRLAARLIDLANIAADETARHAPAAAADLDSTAESIASTWRLGHTAWTSGIINRTAALPYHRDSGNVAGSWSAMYGFRRGVTGGLLHLPAYDVHLPVGDGSLTVFDGQAEMHGVTPFRRSGRHSYRYTIVYYAKTAMRACLADPDDERRRAQRLRTEAEDAKADLDRA